MGSQVSSQAAKNLAVTVRESASHATEELLEVEVGRHSLYPIRDPEVWGWYKTLEGLDWTAQEVDMSRDLDDWRRLPAGQRHYYEHVLGFFVVADELVLDNLDSNFVSEVRQKEAAYFYRAQAKQEGVHSEAYSIQVEMLLRGARKKEVFNAIETMQSVSEMARWAQCWMNHRRTFGERLVAFAAIEGILFSSHFLSILLLKERGLMPGFASYNEFIARDEAVHCGFTCFLLAQRVQRRPAESTAHGIVGRAVQLVDDFVAEAVSAALDAARAAERKERQLSENASGEKEFACKQAWGMDNVVPSITIELMQQYIRHVADTVCRQMGYAAIYCGTNPYPEADRLALNEVAKSNFFEYRATQYQNPTHEGALDFGIDPLGV